MDINTTEVIIAALIGAPIGYVIGITMRMVLGIGYVSVIEEYIKEEVVKKTKE